MVDIYRIGVAFTMTNGVSPVLSVIARDILHVHSRLNEVTKGFNAWRTAIYGAGAALVGTGMVKTMGSMVEHAGKLRHEQELLKIQFADTAKGAKAVADATKAAWETTRGVPGTTVAGNVKTVSDLHEVFGSIETATKAMPQFQKMAQVLEAFGKGGEKSNAGYLAARAMELRGAIMDPKTHTVDEERFQKELGFMSKAVIGTRGRVGPADWVQFIQQAGPAARMIDEKELFSFWPAVIQAMRGNKAGTALNSLSRMTLGGVMSGRTAAEWEKVGLVDPSKVHRANLGSVRTDPGAFKDYDAAHPIQYVWDKVIPALEKAGKGTEEIVKQIQDAFRLQNTSTTGRLLAELIQNRDQIRKAGAVNTGTMGVDPAFSELVANDPTQVMKAFHAAWDSLITSLGDPSVTNAVGVMTKITNALHGMSEFTRENPNGAAGIVTSIASIGAALAIMGSIAVAGAAASVVGAPIVAAIGVIAAALGAYAAIKDQPWYKNFDQGVLELYKKFDAAAQALIQGLATAIKTFIAGIPGAFAGIGSALMSALRSAVSGAFTAPGAGTKGTTDFGPTGTLPAAPMRNIVPSGGGGPKMRQAVIYMDGRKVAEGVVDHMARDGSGPGRGAWVQDQTRSAMLNDYSDSNWA